MCSPHAFYLKSIVPARIKILTSTPRTCSFLQAYLTSKIIHSSINLIRSLFCSIPTIILVHLLLFSSPSSFAVGHFAFPHCSSESNSLILDCLAIMPYICHPVRNPFLSSHFKLAIILEVKNWINRSDSSSSQPHISQTENKYSSFSHYFQMSIHSKIILYTCIEQWPLCFQLNDL